VGELILCSHKLAEHPYDIDHASLHVYSLEELCYYVETRAELLEADFMCEELCTWIERELKLLEAAERLREIVRGGGSLAEFVTCMLLQTGYCSREQIGKIAEVIRASGGRSKYEAGKIRADRHVKGGRYMHAVYAYRRLLQWEEENPVLTGNVWHNLGRAYAGLFFFAQAAECFLCAYDRNQNPESLRACLYACLSAGDEKRFREIAAVRGLPQEKCAEIIRVFREKGTSEEIQAFEERLGALSIAGGEQEIRGIVEDWKETYRKNCKI